MFDLAYTIQTAKSDDYISVKEAQEIQRQVLNPLDDEDYITEEESALVEDLYQEVKAGNIRVEQTSEYDTKFKLKNIADTKLYVSTSSIWDRLWEGDWANKHYLMIDNEGITKVSPQYWGNGQRSFVPFQGIEGAYYSQGALVDTLRVYTSGGSSAISFSFEEDSLQPKEASELISSRVDAWYRRMNQNQNEPSNQFEEEFRQAPVQYTECDEDMFVEIQSGCKVMVYQSDNCNVAIDVMDCD